MASELASKIVAGQLAACVNIIPGIQSVYSWQGKLETGQEFLLMVKTRYCAQNELRNNIPEI